MNPHRNHPATPVAMFTSLWHNRQLIWQMTRREVVGRYRGSIMGLPWSILLFPLVLLPLVFASLGAAWFLAAFGVFVRDVGQITGVFTTILMFLSAVFYPLSALPERYQNLLKLNPLVLIITESRNV